MFVLIVLSVAVLGSLLGLNYVSNRSYEDIIDERSRSNPLRK